MDLKQLRNMMALRPDIASLPTDWMTKTHHDKFRGVVRRLVRNMGRPTGSTDRPRGRPADASPRIYKPSPATIDLFEKPFLCVLKDTLLGWEGFAAAQAAMPSPHKDWQKHNKSRRQRQATGKQPVAGSGSHKRQATGNQPTGSLHNGSRQPTVAAGHGSGSLQPAAERMPTKRSPRSQKIYENPPSRQSKKTLASISHKPAARNRKMCEDCGLKQPSFVLPAEGKRRWCSGCTKGHAGVVKNTNLNKRKSQ